MKKKLKLLLISLIMLPMMCVVVACGKDPGNGDPEPPPATPPATMTSVETEVDEMFASKFNEMTNTFTIEYGDALPNISHFELTASYSDGSSKSLDNIKVVCPREFYEDNMVVRNSTYEFAIVEDKANGETLVEFFVKIVRKRLAVPTVVDGQRFVYNGSAQTLALNGFDEDVMTISNNTQTDAGNYQCSVELIDERNYEWIDPFDLTFDWSIAKAKIDVLSVAGTYVYNGAEQTAVIDYETYDEELFVVTDDKQTNAGEYKVSVEIVNDNYEWNSVEGDEIELDWVIKKAKLNALSVKGGYTYDGTEKIAVIDYKTYSEYWFEVTNNKQTNAGDHKISVKLVNDNCEWIDVSGDVIEIDWIINKKSILTSSLPSVVGEYVYTGEEFEVELDEKFDDSFMRIENGTAIEAGVHTVKIYLDANHKFADSTIETVGYYELEWEIVMPEPEILVVDLSGYDMSDWVGTYNTVAEGSTKTISLSNLPEQVSVSYVHTKDGVEADESDFVTWGTYVTTASIVLKNAYAETYVLPTVDDIDYIPTISNARYESIVIEENVIKISFTWKIFMSEVELKTPEVYEWSLEEGVKIEVGDELPVIVLNKLKTFFEFDYTYYLYDEHKDKYVEIEGVPAEVGKYLIKTEVICLDYRLNSNEIPDFMFEIV